MCKLFLYTLYIIQSDNIKLIKASQMSKPEINNQNPKQKTRKIYTDISYTKRIDLLNLIQKQKYTIKSAAKETGLKLCTAKYILYKYRKDGAISKKKSQCDQENVGGNGMDPVQNTQYIFVPYPVYINYSEDCTISPINLECKQCKEEQ